MSETQTLWIVLQWDVTISGAPLPLSAHYSLDAARQAASSAANMAKPVTIAETKPQTVYLQPAYQAYIGGQEHPGLAPPREG